MKFVKALGIQPAHMIRLILPGNLSRGSRCIANFLPGKRTRSNVISSCKKRPYKIIHKL